MKKTIALALISVIVLNYFVSCIEEPKSEPKDVAYSYIAQYINKESQTPEYIEIQNTFICFYKNSVSNKRRYYLQTDSTRGEKFYGLDSLIIFNKSRDSAITFFMIKSANYGVAGFHYDAVKMFVYKNVSGWRFYDGCATSGYTDAKYTFSMARDNERLWFAFDGEWLAWNKKEVIQNPDFIHHACNMWCGPCADSRDSLNLEIYYRDIKENTPPDSLYHCK